MTSRDIERLNQSFAKAAEQMKGPGALMAEAVRAGRYISRQPGTGEKSNE